MSRWFSFNILTIEPLNLIYYLAILILVFKLGEAVFDYRAGLIAAGIVALWPSFLLHTTQLLRDPLLVLAVLVVIWTITRVAAHTTCAGVAAWSWGSRLAPPLSIIRITRQPMWYLLMAAVAGGTAVLLFRSACGLRHVAAGTAAIRAADYGGDDYHATLSTLLS